ncbi:Flp pilus assembly protein CpaB [Vibrio sp. FNV 38]|nr:Flp pilus assembly protein CpaB [Vibrio sp. FNV 38]
MKNIAVIFVAVLAVVFGSLGVLEALPSKDIKEIADDNAIQNITYVSVWKAARSIQRGEMLTPDMVKKYELPLEQAVVLGVKEDVKLDFTPSTLMNIDLAENKVVLPEFQTKAGSVGYIDLLITEGMTLYPLQVSEKNLISDYIHPGSYIDVLTVSSPSANLAVNADSPKHFRGVKSSMFLKHIKVLSIGNDSKDKDLVKPKTPTKAEGFTTVIIEVHPDDLAKLALAQRTMYIEIYRSQTYQKPTYAEVRNIIDNYTGIEEFRGNESNPREVL